ncbi:MAG TPA: HEAT repeat domain-containing protein [Gemmatimonadales bacterium]|nr:HEAT repeat domain-containing protein [Gemmatimonadales bacterium]
MIRALHILSLWLGAMGGGGDSPGRPGADSARVATLLNALARTDPVICDMIGDQLGNFWWGGDPGRLGRFSDAPNVQGAKDSLAGTITDPRALSLLVSTLGADNQCVRRVAAKLLGQSAVSANVLSELLDNPSPRIRESAAYAAGVGERHETRAALERRLADSETGPAAMAAWALGELQDPASAPALQGAVRSTSPRVRLAAAWALGQFEDASYAKDVLPLLRDVDPVMRVTAAEALGRMKSPRVGAALIGALADRNDAVRLAAVSALADMEERSAVTQIEALLINDPNPEVRRECANALGNLSLGRSLEPLARALGDADVEVQREAANAIEDLDDVTKAPAALVRATTAPDLELRRHATKALAHIGDLATVQALADRLGDADREVRLAAVEGLGEMKVAAAIPGLTRALNDRDPEVRRAAAEALGKTQDN